MRTYCILLLLISIQFAHAQSGSYTPIMNAGALPAEVYTPSASKFETITLELPDTLSKRERKIQQEYYLQSGFGIDEMMRSGTVLYNDAYNNYLNSVADILLANNPQLRTEVHFYLLRSPVVNAFAGAGGNIFISMGLIAMLDNEAQLAYIMAHEIGHVAHQHGLDYFVKASEISKRSSDKVLLKRSSAFDENSIVQNLYSQELESDADAYGIDLLLTTRYSADTNTLNNVFDILKYAYLPYENASFDIAFFEGSNYVISKHLILDSIKGISGTPELPTYKEALKSTHPSIGKRRAAMINKLDALPPEGRSDFIISKSDFEKLRNTSRYELPMYYLHNHFFQDAIYLSYLGLQKAPGNTYLEKIIGKSLTGLSKFRNSKEDQTYAEKARFENYEGQQQQLYYLLWAISDAELNVMALQYNFSLFLKHPMDSDILDQCQALVNDLVFYHFNDEHDFFIDKEISRDSLYALADIANPKLKVIPPGKTSSVKTRKVNIANKRTTPEKTQTDKYKQHLLYAFNNYWNNADFKSLWNTAVAGRDVREQEARELRTMGFKIKDIGDKRNYYTGKEIGADRIVVVNPFYRRIDLRKENAVEYVSGEEGKLNYLDILQKNADLLDLKLTILDPLVMNSLSAPAFNDMSILNDWFAEQLDFGSINLPGYNQPAVDSLAAKYNTDFFLWTGVVSLRDRQKILGPALAILVSPIFAPLLPYGIYALISPEYEFFYLSLLYNVKTHEANVVKFDLLNSNDSRSILNAHTYEMLYNLSQSH